MKRTETGWSAGGEKDHSDEEVESRRLVAHCCVVAASQETDGSVCEQHKATAAANEVM